MSNYRRYKHLDYKSDKPKFIAALSGVFFLAGIYGVIYETIFYYFNSLVLTGVGEIYWRGGGFGPWLQIYGIGGLLMYAVAHRFRDKPLMAFLVSGLSCGSLEFLAGYIFYGLLGLPAGWDYDKEILNVGNIGGYVCLRSVLVFAFSGLFLNYVLFPFIVFLSEKMKRKVFIVLFITIGALFLADCIYNDIFKAIFPDLIYAKPLYESLGIKYMPTYT